MSIAFLCSIDGQMRIENAMPFVLNLHKIILIKYNKLCTKAIQEKHINIDDTNNTTFNK